MTVATCVCCSMISDSQMRYASRVFCHGRSLRPARLCQAMSRGAKEFISLSFRTPCHSDRRVIPNEVRNLLLELHQQQIPRETLGMTNTVSFQTVCHSERSEEPVEQRWITCTLLNGPPDAAALSPRPP